MVRSNKWKLWAVLVLAFALRTNAGIDPIFLAETVANSTGGIWSGAPVPPTIIGMQFFIGTQEPFNAIAYSNGTYLQVDETKLAQAIGGNTFFTKGQTGVFDFYTTNSPAFQSIATTLTDGVNGPFFAGGFGYNPDRIVTGGGWSEGPESAIWQLQPGQDLAGFTIKFFRLIVTETDWGTTTNGGFRISGVSKWQIFGFPLPVRPRLQIYPTALDAYLLAWPTQSIGFLLQSGPDVSSPMSNVQTAPVVVGTNNVVLFPKTGSRAFFRLLYAP